MTSTDCVACQQADRQTDSQTDSCGRSHHLAIPGLWLLLGYHLMALKCLILSDNMLRYGHTPDSISAAAPYQYVPWEPCLGRRLPLPLASCRVQYGWGEWAHRNQDLLSALHFHSLNICHGAA